MKNKIYTFKVSSDDDTFRSIEIKGDESLYELASYIIESFDFDMDHAFGFYSNIEDIYSSDEVYELFVDMDDCDSSKNAKGVNGTMIADVFVIKKEMIFLFDYGDDWMFLVECKDISDPLGKTKYPRVTEKVGEAPEQYPDYEDEE